MLYPAPEQSVVLAPAEVLWPDVELHWREDVQEYRDSSASTKHQLECRLKYIRESDQMFSILVHFKYLKVWMQLH